MCQVDQEPVDLINSREDVELRPLGRDHSGGELFQLRVDDLHERVPLASRDRRAGGTFLHLDTSLHDDAYKAPNGLSICFQSIRIGPSFQTVTRFKDRVQKLRRTRVVGRVNRKPFERGRTPLVQLRPERASGADTA